MKRLGIIKKVIIVHIGISILFLLASYFFWTSQNKQLVNFSLDGRNRAKIILHNNINLLSHQLTSYTYDYTYWDELVAFVQKPNNEWAKINLDETFSNFNITFGWVLDAKLNLVYSTNTVNNKNLLNFPLDTSATIQILNKDKFPHFFLSTEKYLLEVAGAPIQHSADSARTGVPFGYFFTARTWNKEYLDAIEIQNQSKIFHVTNEKLKELIITYDAESNPEIIFTSIPLRDHNGNTLLNLCSFYINNSIKEIREANSKYIPILFVAGGIVLALLLALFNRWILRPINTLSASLSTNKTEKLLELSLKASVFGEFAKLILEFFNQKKSLELEIAKRKQAENELLIKSSAIEQSPLSILIVDPNGFVEYVNPRFIEVSGYTLEEVINAKSFEFLAAEPAENLLAEIAKAVSVGIAWEGETLSRKKSGEYYWENVLVSSIKDQTGKLVHFLVLKENITEKKKILDELISAKEKAEESSRIKDAFFTNMSHELRTPMIGILGFAEIIMYDETDPEIVSKAEKIHKSGQRLLDTLNKVLDLSKAKSDFKEIHLTTVNISAAVKDSFHLFEQAAKQKALNYTLSCADDYNYFVTADNYMLDNIFNNLINNAIKFTHTGSIDVIISGTEEHVMVSVRDTGIGIPKQALGLIFEEFRQVSEGIGRNFTGTGLGLSLTKEYTEILHGKIYVESEVGKGSPFTVQFRIVKREKNRRLNTTREIPQDLGLKNTTNDIKKILIVEDDEITIEVLKSYLNNHYQYDIANNEADVLELIDRSDYHAIIMDVNLGRGGNGIVITKKIKLNSRNSAVPIIAATAFAMAGDKEEFLEAGCDYYLSKPYLRKELLTILNSI